MIQAHDGEETLAQIAQEDFALVFINRKLDRDYSDGLEIIRQIKADPQLASTRVMLISNYSEHQELAIAAGAEHGFGKLEIGNPETVDRLRPFLGA